MTSTTIPGASTGEVRVERVATRDQLERCWSIRLDVFVGEQEVPIEEEIDDADTDPSTVHVLALDAADGAPLGTGRLLGDEDHPEDLHIGRMAVRREARGRHVGAAVMTALEQIALARERELAAARGRDPRPVTITLSAQERAMGFYARLGYAVVSGESYLDAGIPHQDMARTLTP